MQRKTFIGYALVGLAAAALLAWAFAPRPLEVELASAAQGRFEATIEEDGKTRLPDKYTVSAPLAGRLARITLREGDAVEAGAVVATLTPVLAPLLDERSALAQASRVEAAAALVQRAAVGTERAQVSLEQARTELRRSEQLARDGFVSPTKLDGDRLAVQAAQKSLEAAQQDRHVAEHELAQARAAVLAVRPAGVGKPADLFVVRAPVAGRVLRVLQSSEGTVALGTPLVEIGDVGQLEIVAELLTTDALRLPPQAPVRIERWGGPADLAGRVRRVEPAAFTKVSALGVEEQRVKVLIDLTSPPEKWRALGDGYRVGLRIVTLAVDDAVMVPVSAVFPQEDGAKPGAMAAFVVEGGRARRVPVTLGARNGVTAWVKNGLAPGAQVIVYPPATLQDGARVKPRQV